jgi:hypothetical protein
LDVVEVGLKRHGGILRWRRETRRESTRASARPCRRVTA